MLTSRLEAVKQSAASSAPLHEVLSCGSHKEKRLSTLDRVPLVRVLRQIHKPNWFQITEETVAALETSSSVAAIFMLIERDERTKLPPNN